MTVWKHPHLGPIECMPRRLRPKKVWSHMAQADLATRIHSRCLESATNGPCKGKTAGGAGTGLWTEESDHDLG